MKRVLFALVKEGQMKPEMAEGLVTKQCALGLSFLDALMEVGGLDELAAKKAISRELHIPFFQSTVEKIDPVALACIPLEQAQRLQALPLRIEDERLVVAMHDPLDLAALEDLKFMTGMTIIPRFALKKDILEGLGLHTSGAEKVDNSFNEFIGDMCSDKAVEDSAGESEDRKHSSQAVVEIEKASLTDSRIVTLANGILSEATKQRATDIHVEPQENYVEVRYRIDGTLKSVMKIPNAFRASLTARIKIITGLNIAETRTPQDGRMRIAINGRRIDLRISSIPTFYGEKIALRLLDRKEAKTELANLGLRPEDLNALTEAATRPQGMILTTGPTGSGKTSTLYAMLNLLRKEKDKNIVTIEDPIEYLMDGVNQTQTNPIKNLTFTTGLRAMLRQDPNVILVGEIRDRETAEIAFRASLTGHLVLSTLHANSTVATVTRLLDIGLEPYLISSSVILVIAQRLIRLNCEQCNDHYTPDPKLVDMFRTIIDGYHVEHFSRGKGCETCSGTGFFGRTAVFEILTLSSAIRQLIVNRAPEEAIVNQARREGYRELVESGIEKVALGLTCLEEIKRVVDFSPQQGKATAEKLSHSVIKIQSPDREGVSHEY